MLNTNNYIGILSLISTSILFACGDSERTDLNSTTNKGIEDTSAGTTEGGETEGGETEGGETEGGETEGGETEGGVREIWPGRFVPSHHGQVYWPFTGVRLRRDAR